MCDADRARFGGPEWLELSLRDLLDEETGLIEQIEVQWDITPDELERGMRRGSLFAARAMVWAALRKAGVDVPAYGFRPKVLGEDGATFEALPSERGDADPPVEAAAENRGARRAAKKTTARRGPAKAAVSPT